MIKRLMLSPGNTRRAALVITAAGALTAIAACGSGGAAGHSASAGGMAARTPTPGGRAAQPALCMAIPKLTSMAERPTTTLHGFEPSQVLPGGVVVRNRVFVRDLAAVLCRLPPAPRALVNCPARLGGRLRLEFNAEGRRFPPVFVQLSGCRVVRGFSLARAPSAALWRALTKALGFRLPPTIRGGGHSAAG
jgi:hypothetical protein